MGTFLEAEKPKQAAFKASSGTISAFAKAQGYYKDHPYAFCLPREHTAENLYTWICDNQV